MEFSHYDEVPMNLAIELVERITGRKILIN